MGWPAFSHLINKHILFSFLGHCVFQSPNMGVLSLVPYSGSRLALVITGTSLSSIRDVIHLATPTIPPMARSPFSNLVPNYVITGPDFRAQGPGGCLCAGFGGNRWEYRSDISSCACSATNVDQLACEQAYYGLRSIAW